MLLRQHHHKKRHERHLSGAQPVHQQRSNVELLHVADLSAEVEVHRSNAKRAGVRAGSAVEAVEEPAEDHVARHEYRGAEGRRVLQFADDRGDRSQHECHLVAEDARVREHEESVGHLLEREPDHRD